MGAFQNIFHASRDGGLSRVKLGPGVVGNSTFAILALCIAAPGIAWALRDYPSAALIGIGLIAAVVVLYFIGTWIYAHLHPDHALMGGAELLQLRQMQMAAPGTPVIEGSPIVADPESTVATGAGLDAKK
jgi:hypothetical protein